MTKCADTTTVRVERCFLQQHAQYTRSTQQWIRLYVVVCHDPPGGYRAHHLPVQSKPSRRLDYFFYKCVRSLLILIHGRFYKKNYSISSKARRYPNRKQDVTFVNFNITAGMWDLPLFLTRLKMNYMSDLTPLFNWNTKQVFLYLEAEYDNVKGVRR